ncbi:N-acetyltransferase [Flammeovirga sp. SJP92]|uniref:GNAT family N-acetyltransferase n=1 Tax=Flammeovirga sp. SJP92 TaxID=1775430 RepID=UPI000787453F|nr:GNAT family N-acetyltransferase [Flammeovirga sp. SJP92]KXX70685.1 acetyltransferase [Flammeovirga sp. SJP92]
MKIEVTSNPKAEDLKTISEGIQSYNQEYISNEVVFEQDTKFAVFVKDNQGNVLGGIRACAFWNYCIIELLWISKEARGMGVGSQLISSAERYAIENGFEYMRTETLSFQARPFYEQQGYKVYGELADYPKGHTTYCLVKKL